MKTFTLLQLFSIIDGRLSTSIDDVYDMLNTYTGQSLMTHHLPTAMSYLKLTNPKWYADVAGYLEDIKLEAGNDFAPLIEHIRVNHNSSWEIIPMNESEQIEFGEYMVNNSLLSKIGTA